MNNGQTTVQDGVGEPTATRNMAAVSKFAEIRLPLNLKVFVGPHKYIAIILVLFCLGIT